MPKLEKVGRLDFNKKAYLQGDQNTSSGFNKYAYLGIDEKKPSLLERFGPQALNAVKSIANDPGVQMGLNVASGDVGNTLLAAKGMAQDPATAVRSPTVQAGLPIAGGVVGGIPGAMTGDALRQMAGVAVAPETVPKTAFGKMASVLGAGIAQEPKVLNAIPGVPQVSEMAGNLMAKMGKGAARLGETLTGVKAKDLTQAAKQGISTYLAPSLEKASDIFGKAVGPEGAKALKVPAEEAFDSALSNARSFAKDIGSKIEQGQPVSSIDALKARQATDRVISSTPVMDKLTRRSLYDWRSKFDDIISSQNGPLKDASDIYRKAIVKDKILNLTRLNKSGEPSAFLPMLAGHSMAGKGIEGGLGMLTGTSPLVAGLAATVGGSTARGLNSIAQNPAARQALLQILQRIRQNSQQPQEQP